GLAHGAGVAATGAGGLTAPRVSPVGAASAATGDHDACHDNGSRLKPLLQGHLDAGWGRMAPVAAEAAPTGISWMLAGVARAWSRLKPLLQEDDLVLGDAGPQTERTRIAPGPLAGQALAFFALAS